MRMNCGKCLGWAGAGMLALVLAGCAGQAANKPAAQPAQPQAVEARAMVGDLREKAIDQVIASSRSGDAFLRANAIEAIQSVPARALPFVHLGLEDDHPAVRFAALATIGKLRLKDLAPAAQRGLRDDNESVRAAALFALHQCGQKVDLTPMAKLLASRTPGARSNAAMLLGWMGEKSAGPMLKQMAKLDMPRVSEVQTALVRLQMAEAMLRLGDDTVIDSVRAAMYSQFDEVRVLAVTLMGDLNDRRFAEAVAQLLREPPVELQMAAATTLAKFGQFDGLPVILAGGASSLPTQRAQAALALGVFPNIQAAQMLGKLLDDPVEQVRLSAAAGVLRSTAGR